MRSTLRDIPREGQWAQMASGNGQLQDFELVDTLGSTRADRVVRGVLGVVAAAFPG
jgi:hypothetical protein